MRITVALLRKILPTNARTIPRASFRRPMQGRYRNRKKDPKPWDTSMGELDEEIVNEAGRTVALREKVPMIMVPDLKDFKLKPYVTYKVEKHYEPALESRDLFNTFYAPQIEAELSGTRFEPVPDATTRLGLLTRVKSAFLRQRKSDISVDETSSNKKTE